MASQNKNTVEGQVKGVIESLQTRARAYGRNMGGQRISPMGYSDRLTMESAIAELQRLGFKVELKSFEEEGRPSWMVYSFSTPYPSIVFDLPTPQTTLDDDTNLVNLTPHEVKIYDAEGKELVMQLPPSGAVARCSVQNTQTAAVRGVPLFASKYGEVTDLPTETPGTLFVVSLLVRQALPQRKDLVSPGELIRNDAGQPIGCKGLSINE